MTRTPAPATAIEFVHRPAEQPRRYRWFTQLADHWRGRRDARFLSDAQVAAGGDVVALTPWIDARLSETAAVVSHEEMTLTRILDPLRRQERLLVAELESLRSRLTSAQELLVEIEAAGPKDSAPVGAGEALESADERTRRRSRQHAGRVERATAERDAIERRIAAAESELAEVRTMIANAEDASAYRSEAARSYARRRIAAYTRGLQRRVPSAVVVRTLATAVEAAPARAIDEALGSGPARRNPSLRTAGVGDRSH